MTQTPDTVGDVRVLAVRTGDGLTMYGKDLAVPNWYRLGDTPEDGLPYSIELQVIMEHGQPVCSELVCRRLPDGPPVTGEGIRKLSIATLVRNGARKVAVRVVPGDDETWISIIGTDEETPGDARSLDDAARLAGGRTRRWRLTDDHLRRVAAIYDDAAGRKGPAGVPTPTLAVQKHYGIERPTASRWVKAAEAHGLLSAASERFRRRQPAAAD